MKRETAELHRATAESLLEVALGLEALACESLEEAMHAAARAPFVDLEGVGIVPSPFKGPSSAASRLRFRAEAHLRHLASATVEGRPALEAVPWKRGTPALVERVNPDGSVAWRKGRTLSKAVAARRGA